MSYLKEKLLSSFIAFEEQKNVDSYVHGIRTKAIKKFEQEGFPTKKLENWKYTSLKKAINYDYKLFPNQSEVLEFRDIKKYLIEERTLLRQFFIFKIIGCKHPVSHIIYCKSI